MMKGELNMANYIVSSGEVSSGIILEGVSMTILDGGMADTTTVNVHGSMFVSSGGTANSTTVNEGGRFYVSSGGTANSTTVNYHCSMFVNGGTANSTTINFGQGGMDVSRGGVANSTTVNVYGSMFISSGGTANNTTVNGGIMRVNSGTASSTTVNKGSMYVASGGIATEIVENGGYVNVGDGAIVSFASNSFSGLVLSSSQAASVHSGTTANSTMIASNRGCLSVSSGGIANSTTVNPGGSMYVRSGGKLTGRIIRLPGGVVSAYEGSIIDFDLSRVWPGAGARINDLAAISGSPVYTITVNADQAEGVYTLAENADSINQAITIVNTSGEELGTLSTGETIIISNVAYTLNLSDSILSLKVGENNTPSPYTSDGLVINNSERVTVRDKELYHDTLIVSRGSMTVSSGGTANNTTLFGILLGDINLCMLTIFPGGVADDTTLGFRGRMVVFNGGTAKNTVINNSCNMEVSSGGIVNSTTVNSGGRLFVSYGGSATEILENGGHVDVQEGANVTFVSHTLSGPICGDITIHSGTVADSTFFYGGYMSIFSGGIANNTVNSRRYNGEESVIKVYSGGTANVTTLDNGGTLFVSSGGTANVTILNEGKMFVSSGGTANSTTVNDVNCSIDVYPDGTANSTIVNSRGRMAVFSGGTASIVFNPWQGEIDSSAGAEITYLERDAKVYYGNYIGLVSKADIMDSLSIEWRGSAIVYSGGTVNNTTVISGGYLIVSSGGMVNNTTDISGGYLIVSSGGTATGKMAFEVGAVVSVYNGAVLDFDISGLTAEAGARVNNLAIIQGAPKYTLTVSAEQTSGIYTLAEGAADFNGTLTVQSVSGESFGRFAVGETLKVGYNSFILSLTDSVLSVTVEVPDMTPTASEGTPEQVSWEDSGANSYIVEYSLDNFEHVIQLVTTGDAIDSPELPAGSYQWRVKADANSDWAVGNTIVSEAESDEPKVVQSNEDGNDDLFFATASGAWENIYYAQHVGSINDWTGTNEMVSAAGKGRIQNLFFGSFDPNVLCLTDSENGDAIFVDDVYTDLPDEIAEHTARLYKIQEVRAGFGDDIVDMTSQRFEYIGDGLTIRGGAGNDTIWANKGNNMLFGDAGNDRLVGASGNDVIVGGIGDDSMHGGGGNDIFTFYGNWGVDTVKQLETGSVTLWFANGDDSHWDASTLTYTDGDNSVKVSGVAAEQVTLRFGDDGSEQFATLSGTGAFDDFTSQKIFEESGKGILACL